MFEAVLGHSFKCVSEQSIQLSRHLQLKMMNTQLQAFDFEGDHFGNGKSRVFQIIKLQGGAKEIAQGLWCCLCLLNPSHCIEHPTKHCQASLLCPE